MSLSAKILLVEDDLDLMQGWIELFELIGHEVRAQSRGLAAAKDLSSIQWCDLLITDYYLPDINGVELIRRLRVIRPELPVFLLTGSRDRGIFEATALIKNCQLLYKPINIDQLESKIGHVLSEMPA